MPEAAHYEDDLLDFCYVYTFDEKYKAGHSFQLLFHSSNCFRLAVRKLNKHKRTDIFMDGLGWISVMYIRLMKNTKPGFWQIWIKPMKPAACF